MLKVFCFKGFIFDRIFNYFFVLQALLFCWSIRQTALTVKIMKVQFWLRLELELFIHTTRSFYMTGFWLTELLVLDRTVLIGITIMEVVVIITTTMVMAREACLFVYCLC